MTIIFKVVPSKTELKLWIYPIITSSDHILLFLWPDIWQLQCTGGVHTTCETFGFAQSKNQVQVYSLKIIPHGEQDNHEISW
jgi:hypothetical protein